MSQPELDRLVILLVTGPQSDSLMKQLSREDFHFTVIDSTSEVMQESVTGLMIGFPHIRLPDLLRAVRENCKSYRQYIPTQGILSGEKASLSMVEAQLGGALIYMLNVERFEQI